MSNEKIALYIFVAAAVTLFLRALPFIAFSGGRQMPAWMEKLGNRLPSAVMAVLIIYCLKDVGNDFMHDGIAKLIAVLVVGVSYKWKHNILLSAVAGTALYMVLLVVL